MQDCDALLHEAGAPPIHTPISVLQALPEKIKERLYVVHTSALPPDSGLRVAPTGTAGTIRLDQRSGAKTNGKRLRTEEGLGQNGSSGIPQTVGHLYAGVNESRNTGGSSIGGFDTESLDDGGHPSLSVVGDYGTPSVAELSHLSGLSPDDKKLPPLVFLRPTCVSDAWFILNLLSAVPFFSR